MERVLLDSITCFGKRFDSETFNKKPLYKRCVSEMLQEVEKRYKKVETPSIKAADKKKRSEELLQWALKEFDKDPKGNFCIFQQIYFVITDIFDLELDTSKINNCIIG